MENKMNRETYLNKMAYELKMGVFKQSHINLDLSKVKISCGYPTTGSKGKAIGQCHATSNNGYNEIFIHPILQDSIKVCGVLAHELIHAHDDCEHGHGKEFRKMALSIGLEGKMTATTESEEFVKEAQKIVDKLGEYPHKKLESSGTKKKQTTRMVKVVCYNCNQYHVRMSRKMFELAPPVCGHCYEYQDIVSQMEIA